MTAIKKTYLTEADIFSKAIKLAENQTQAEIAAQLGCRQPSVSKMLNRNPKMISLAIRFIQESEARRVEFRPCYLMETHPAR